MKKTILLLLVLFTSLIIKAQTIDNGALATQINAEGIVNVTDKQTHKEFEIINTRLIDNFRSAEKRDRIANLPGVVSFGITWAEQKIVVGIENKYITKYLNEEFAIPANLLKEYYINTK